MKKVLILTTLFFITISAAQSDAKAKAIVDKVTSKVGSYNDLKKLKNVEYTYTFRNPNTQKEDVSTERYIFNGQVSWAKYTHHKEYVATTIESPIIQYYNGVDKVLVVDGAKNNIDSKEVAKAGFLRKTNFYWFAMMQKLQDPGLIYTLLPNRTVNNINYEVVKLGFEKNIGDVQDEYILYVNPKTLLIDQFIFTVKALKFKTPMLMKIKYKEIDGVYLMVERDIYKSDWNGKHGKNIIFEQRMDNISFTKNFTKETLVTTDLILP